MFVAHAELVPASARSSSSAAAPLPAHLVPLLGGELEKIVRVVDSVLPSTKRLTPLEEAEFEDDDEDGALEREMLTQCESSGYLSRPLYIIPHPQRWKPSGSTDPG